MDKPVQRTTRQRTAVTALLAKQDGFRTAQQIYDALREAGESVGLTTVYRTLQGMAEAGDVDVVRTIEGEMSYKRCVTETHHHHLVCNVCLKSVDIDGDSAGALAEKLAKEHGFHDVDHELEFRGICSDCYTARS